MKWFSAYGTDATMFDVEPEPKGKIRFTVWLSIFWMPIIPLSSWSAIYLGESIAATESDYFKDLVRMPHQRNRLMRTWLLAVFGLVATVGPLSLMTFRTNGRGATPAEMVVVFALTGWTVGLLIFLEDQRKKKLSGDHIPTVIHKNLAD
jgi:hypothetical protein